MELTQDKSTKKYNDDNDLLPKKPLNIVPKSDNNLITIKKKSNSAPIKKISAEKIITNVKNVENMENENEIQKLKPSKNKDPRLRNLRCISAQTLVKIDPSNKDQSSENLHSPLSNPQLTRNNTLNEAEKFSEIYKGAEDTNIFEDDTNSKNISNNIKTVFFDSRNISTEENNNNNNINVENNNNENSSSNSLSRVQIQEGFDFELNFYRNGEDIRRSYIAKLIYKNVYNPNLKPKTHNSLIIFDWDDTLLPTTFLTPNGTFNENLVLSEQVKKKISKLEISVSKLLKIAVEKGDVYIITNAGVGWVEFSANRFYPSVTEILKKIKIISARGEFEEQFPGDSRKWKIQTFLTLQNKLNLKLVTNIICLGDSLFEMEAGRVLASQFTQAFIKTVKFRERPKPDELNKQLNLVITQFNSIYSAVKNLTVRVEKKKKKEEDDKI